MDGAEPLAERMRPGELATFVGQEHLLGDGRALQRCLRHGDLHSMVLWGPPGTGKTTLARLLARATEAEWRTLSAVTSGVRELRAVVAEATQLRAQGRRLVLFVDEVHRFNKAQQDGFLPPVEDGTLLLIGATTENPSFELNNALLSRLRVHVLRPLTESDLLQLLTTAIHDRERGLGGRELTLSADAAALLARAADGDARRALTLLETAADLADTGIGIEQVSEAIGSGWRRFDQGGDLFYDQVSALHKSIRGSSPDAALYWLCRLLDGGCDPLYLARRLVRVASEDVGNADPRALQLALDVWDVQTRLGSPEGELALAQAVTYLASVPKSDAVYKAFGRARRHVAATGTSEVPLHLRNAPTRLLRELGHGRLYRHAHDEPDGYAAGESYWPDGLAPQQYYRPVNRGLETRIAERLRQLAARDRAARKP